MKEIEGSAGLVPVDVDLYDIIDEKKSPGPPSLRPILQHRPRW